MKLTKVGSAFEYRHKPGFECLCFFEDFAHRSLLISKRSFSFWLYVSKPTGDVVAVTQHSKVEGETHEVTQEVLR